VRFPDGTVFSFTGCTGERNTSHEVLTDPAGPKPGGQAPRNDEPADAIALIADRVRTDQSGGAAPAAEAPLWCDDDPPYPEEQTGSTLWYTVRGHGPGHDGRHGRQLVQDRRRCLRPEGRRAGRDRLCRRRVRRHAAGPATFATEPGELYLVQVGGYADEFGNLRLALR
jgi:hypothetical protein